MNKTAAMRSQARRAVLVKAAMDPAQIAGILAMTGGGALGGSAVTGDDQSLLKRVGKGALGAGLTYAGYKLMTDPMWQQKLTSGASKARDLVAGLLGKAKGAAKAAEAKAMSTDVADAYVAGFQKAAEAAGVDPVALYKQALPQWVGKIGGGFKRFGQLLAGTGKPLAAANKALGEANAVIDAAAKGNGAGFVRRALAKGVMRPVAAYSVYRGDFGREAMKELAKVHATRLGTGAAALGAGSLMFGGGDDQQPQAVS